MSPKKKLKSPKVKKNPGMRRVAPECKHRVSLFDLHRYCAHCRSCSRDVPCSTCAAWSEDEWKQYEANRRKYASTAGKDKPPKSREQVSLSSGHTPPVPPHRSSDPKPTPPAKPAPPPATVAETPESPSLGSNTNNFAPAGAVGAAVTTPVKSASRSSGAPIVQDVGSRSPLSVSSPSSSDDSRSASDDDRSDSGSQHSAGEDAESSHSSPPQQHCSRARVRDSPVRRQHRSPTPTGRRHRTAEDDSEWRQLWPPPAPDRLHLGNQSWNPHYGPPQNLGWPMPGASQQWPAQNAWNAPCAPPAWWQYPLQNIPLSDAPRPPATATESRAEPATPATQPSALELELRLKITALEREADLLKLQVQLKEASSNDSTASLNRPTSVPFAELVKEVYKYLPEDVCSRDEVPATDRSYGSNVLSQFVPQPKVALP